MNRLISFLFVEQSDEPRRRDIESIKDFEFQTYMYVLDNCRGREKIIESLFILFPARVSPDVCDLIELIRIARLSGTENLEDGQSISEERL